MKHFLIFLILLSFPSYAEEEKTSDKSSEGKEDFQGSVTQDGSVTIAGNRIDYTVTAAKLMLKKDSIDQEKRASIFHVSYLKKDVADHSKRPIMFAFNGGPGSSAVWLHLGALGPKLVPTSEDGTIALKPPVTLKDNNFSILDVTDLVFIDPVSTGYSRTQKDAKKNEFHSVNGDVSSVGDFIRRWVTENDRWNSPKYLLGESYGGIRAAGLANHLQDRYGMSLNGVVLLSSLLDFRTLRSGDGDYTEDVIFLPNFTGTAHHHGKITGDRDALQEQCRAFAKGAYLTALHKGSSISAEEKSAVAKKLEEFTGISASLWESSHLRIGSNRFRRELLRTEKKTLGRFDSRVAWPANQNDSHHPSFDPSYAVVYGAFATSMNDFLSRELGWEESRPYEILTGNVHPWNWGRGNGYINKTRDVAKAMQNNPHLRVLVMCGRTDLATPPDGLLYSLDQAYMPKASSDRISTTWYDAGHMFYLNQPDLEKMRTDLVEFIEIP